MKDITQKISRYFPSAILVIILVHLLLLFYFLVFRQFFQQDEWHSFGLILSLKERFISLDRPFWELILGGARVGARVIGFYLFNIFKLNPFPYGIMAFFYHSTNTLLVFLIARTLTKQKITALLAALFFLINEVGNEAYSWFGTMNGSATSVIFFLLSFLALLKFIESKKYSFVLLSYLFLWFSFLFKETAVFAFIFYPYVFWIYQRSSLKSLFIKLLPFFLLALGVIGYMVKIIFVISGDQANYIGGQASFLPNLILHLFQYPLEGAAQAFLPIAAILYLSNLFTRIFFRSLAPDTIEFEIAVQNISAEIICLGLFLGGIILGIRKIKKRFNLKAPEISRTLSICALFLILSFLPYVVLNRSFAFLDSRHYYLATVASSIFLATFLVNLIGLNTQKARIIFITIILGYAILHETVLFSDFRLMAQRSRERQGFLKQMLCLVPKLPKKTVFYVTGNYPGYYGLPELKVPFQSGPGHVLMVVYSVDGQLDPNFFREEPWQKALDVGFLYDILGQGYREVKGKGFGYYYDQQELEKAINRNLFSKKEVISLYYNADTGTLEQREY